MSLSTTPFPRLQAGILRWLPWLGKQTGTYATPATDMDPRLLYVARPVRAVTAETRLATVIEQMRMSPYRAVPVVEAEGISEDGSPHGRLIGMVTEEAIVHLFLATSDTEERSRLRELPVQSVMETPEYWANTFQHTSEAAALFDTSGADVLPVVDGNFHFLGLVARSDLIRELARPFRPPMVGGMATPVGVYLTTGGVSGGAGSLALFLTGLAMFLAHLLAYVVAQPLADASARLPAFARPTLEVLAPLVAQTGLFLLLIRLSPLAGYHAAEHQVVHALERGEPLLVDAVRKMPRVHPRCGTNLAAGGLLLGVVSATLEPLLTRFHLPEELAYILAGIVAFAYWRTLGSWLQQYLTTRPATDRQIESGIRAAHQLLEAHGRNPYAPARPHQRLWRMGFVQILAGFAVGYGLVLLAAYLFPALEPAVRRGMQGLF